MNILPLGASPANPAPVHTVIAAAERFLAIGGRLMISPRGRLLTAIDFGLLYITAPEDGVRRETARTFRRASLQRGSTRRLKRMVITRGKPVSGWLVLEAI
jgi:hypothetical protein